MRFSLPALHVSCNSKMFTNDFCEFIILNECAELKKKSN